MNLPAAPLPGGSHLVNVGEPLTLFIILRAEIIAYILQERKLKAPFATEVHNRYVLKDAQSYQGPAPQHRYCDLI